MSYRPLPDNLTLKLSTIEGFGPLPDNLTIKLSTKKKIDKFEDLGISHLKLGKEMFRTPLGGFLNHSDTPNCQKIEVDGRYYIQTLRDIKEGEELTLKYTLYNV